MTRGFVLSIPSNPADMQPCCFPPFPLLLFSNCSQKTPTFCIICSSSRRHCTSFFTYWSSFSFTRSSTWAREGGEEPEVTQEPPPWKGQQALAQAQQWKKEGRARRAGAGNSASSLRKQRRGGLRSASCAAPFVTPSHLLQAKATKRRRSLGEAGMEAAGQPGALPVPPARRNSAHCCAKRGPQSSAMK